MIKHFLMIGMGGAVGSMMRYAVGLRCPSKTFPSSTFIINISGSLLIGLAMGYFLKEENISNNWKLFVVTGICGGFTTFSTFSFENLQLLQQGKITLSLFYITSSVLLCIAASWLGYKFIT